MKCSPKFVAALLPLVLIATSLYAATPKAGGPCSKAGATSTYAGKKYTCIKSGKKLVWNKGVKVSVPKPVATPTPTPTANPFAAGPQGPSCGTVKVKQDEVIVGQIFYKGTYEIHAMGLSCSKVLGEEGIFQQFLNLRDDEKLPSPWRYLEGAVGAPKFVKGPSVGFRVQRISD